mmetsp:Transcript_24030/g.43234  ORF Transcript_24030/g.43234 Transcript_24030/m.43234 type:complete len:271 (+) Transcript_24030:2037-2849(+)
MPLSTWASSGDVGSITPVTSLTGAVGADVGTSVPLSPPADAATTVPPPKADEEALAVVSSLFPSPSTNPAIPPIISRRRSKLAQRKFFFCHHFFCGSLSSSFSIAKAAVGFPAAPPSTFSKPSSSTGAVGTNSVASFLCSSNTLPYSTPSCCILSSSARLANISWSKTLATRSCSSLSNSARFANISRSNTLASANLSFSISSSNRFCSANFDTSSPCLLFSSTSSLVFLSSVLAICCCLASNSSARSFTGTNVCGRRTFGAVVHPLRNF